MIGKIVVLLLAAVCFSGIFTEAQVNLCDTYKARASYSQIMGFAYVEEFSRGILPCLTLNIELASKLIVIVKNYTITYTYDDAGSLTSEQSHLLEESVLQAGKGQTYLADSEDTPELDRETVIVGYVGDSSGFKGYALASCSAEDGSMYVAILVKSLPADSSVVSQLKAQLPKDLQSTFLSVIPHNSTCDYAPH